MTSLPDGYPQVSQASNFIEQLASDEERQQFINDIIVFYKERMHYWQVVALNNGWSRNEFSRYCQGVREGLMIMLAATDSRPANLASYRLTTSDGRVIGFDPSVCDDDTPGIIVAIDKEIIH